MSEQKVTNEIFVSYSRLNANFVMEFISKLKNHNIDPWFDIDDIPKGRDWWLEIQKGIDEANAFIFVISSGSLCSEVCNWELAHALKYSKKIIPLLVTDVFADKQLMQELGSLEWDHPSDENKIISASANWKQLKDLNFIRYCDNQNLNKAVDEAILVARTDYDYLNEHKRILNRAREWESNNQKQAFLFTGDEIQVGEVWLEQSKAKNPLPSELHRKYILSSRKNAIKQRRRLVIGITVASIIILIATIIGFLQYSIANFRAKESFSRYLANTAQDELLGTFPERAILLGIEALENYPYTVEAEKALADAIYSNEPIRQFQIDFGRSAADVVFSPSGEHVIASARGGDVYVWNVDSGVQVQQFGSRSLLGEDIAIHPSNEYIMITGSYAEIWDEYGRIYKSMPLTNGILRSAQFDTTGQRIVATSEFDGVTIWDYESKEVLQQFEGWWQPNDAKFSPDGTLIAAVAGNVYIWNIETEEQISEADTKDLPLTVNFSPDGQTVLVGGYEGYFSLIDVETGELLSEIQAHEGEIEEAIFSPDGNTFLTAGSDGFAHLWSVDTMTILKTFVSSDGVNSATFSPNGKLIAIAGEDGTVSIWYSFYNFSILFSAEKSYQQVNFATYDEYHETINTLSLDGTVRIWDTASYNLIDVLPFDDALIRGYIPPDFVSEQEFFSSGLMAIDKDNRYAIFLIPQARDANSQIMEDIFKDVVGETMWFDAPAILVDLHTSDTTGNSVFDPSGVFPLDMHEGIVWDADFSPDGTHVLTVGEDFTARLWEWDTIDAHLLATFSEHRANVYIVEFDALGRRFATSSEDGSIRIWDVSSSSSLITLSNYSSRILSMSFDPSGNYLVTASENNIVRIHRIYSDWQTLINIARECCVIRQLTPDERLRFNLDQ